MRCVREVNAPNSLHVWMRLLSEGDPKSRCHQRAKLRAKLSWAQSHHAANQCRKARVTKVKVNKWCDIIIYIREYVERERGWIEISPHLVHQYSRRLPGEAAQWRHNWILRRKWALCSRSTRTYQDPIGFISGDEGKTSLYSVKGLRAVSGKVLHTEITLICHSIYTFEKLKRGDCTLTESLWSLFAPAWSKSSTISGYLFWEAMVSAV